MSKYQYRVKGVDYDVEIQEVKGNIAKVTVNDIPFEVELKQPIRTSQEIHKPVHVEAPEAKEEKQATAVQPKVEQPKVSQNAGKPVNAPLPGTITDVKVKVGDTIKAGDTVVVLEAMKMQNNIEAETDGKVISILVNKGDTVMEGSALVTIG